MNSLDPNFKRSNKIFKAYMEPFISIHTYLKTIDMNGTYIIPLTGDPECFKTDSNDSFTESEDYENKGDVRLLRIYRMESRVNLKNIKKFGEGHFSKGLMLKVENIIDYADSFINSLPKFISSKLEEKINNVISNVLRDKITNHISSAYIWIPIWNINSKDALIVNIRDTIYLIFT